VAENRSENMKFGNNPTDAQIEKIAVNIGNLRKTSIRDMFEQKRFDNFKKMIDNPSTNSQLNNDLMKNIPVSFD